MPVPCNTRIQVWEDGTFLGETYTGIPCPTPSPPILAGVPDLDDNEYSILVSKPVTQYSPVSINFVETPAEQARPKAIVGTVNFQIEWDCGGGLVLLMAVETAPFDTDQIVIQDLHSSCSVGGIIEPVDLLEQSATSGEPSDGASASTFIALGIGIAVLLAALIVWSVRRRRVA